MTKPIIIKITAWVLFIFCCLTGLSIIALIFLIPFFIPGANFSKLVIVDFGIFILGGFFCLLGFGIFEFFYSLIKVEEEVKEIEKEVSIEKGITRWPPR